MLEQRIQSHSDFIRWLDAFLDGKDVPSEERVLLAGSSFDLVMEYQKAIVILVNSKIHGPAFAMMRSIREVFVRGVWLAKCATTDQVRSVRDGGKFPSTGTMIEAIEKTESYSGGPLSKMRKETRDWMHGMTHGGMEQIARRFSGVTIEPVFEENELVELLDFAFAHAALSGIEVCGLAGDGEGALGILEKVKSLTR